MIYIAIYLLGYLGTSSIFIFFKIRDSLLKKSDDSATD